MNPSFSFRTSVNSLIRNLLVEDDKSQIVAM